MSEPITLERIASQEDFAYFSRLAFNDDVMVPNMGRVFTQEEAEGYFAWLLESNQTHPDSGCYKVLLSHARPCSCELILLSVKFHLFITSLLQIVFTLYILSQI